MQAFQTDLPRVTQPPHGWITVQPVLPKRFPRNPKRSEKVLKKVKIEVRIDLTSPRRWLLIARYSQVGRCFVKKD
jgi:hypothetical protein